MPGINLFLDSSAVILAIVSARSAACALLLLIEADQIAVTISKQVLAETERTIARQVPVALNDLRQVVLASHAQIAHDPSQDEVRAYLNLISHPADIPVVLAAMQTKVDYLVAGVLTGNL